VFRDEYAREAQLLGRACDVGNVAAGKATLPRLGERGHVDGVGRTTLNRMGSLSRWIGRQDTYRIEITRRVQWATVWQSTVISQCAALRVSARTSSSRTSQTRRSMAGLDYGFAQGGFDPAPVIIITVCGDRQRAS